MKKGYLEPKWSIEFQGSHARLYSTLWTGNDKNEAYRRFTAIENTLEAGDHLRLIRPDGKTEFIVHQKTKNPKPASQITDRAKRYRAVRNSPPGRKLCNFCASTKNVDVDHISGDESEGDPENLMYLCRPCNTAKGVTQARNKIGVRTAQFNPQWGTTFAGFQHAAAVLTGIDPGDVGRATAAIRATPPAKRAEYAERIARNPEPPDFKQYLHGVVIHQRGSHDAGGKIIHATPPELRSQYAREIAAIKSRRRGEVPF